MGQGRIIDIALDEATIIARNADIEAERRVALLDLIDENVFIPVRATAAGHPGPYRLQLSVVDGRLGMGIADEAGADLGGIILGLARLRRHIRDYFAICGSYYQAVRRASAHEIETIDMARRAIHDAAAVALLAALEGKVETDHATARRLFTLICVLHAR